MSITKSKLSVGEFESILKNLLEKKTIRVVKHPADAILIFEIGKPIPQDGFETSEISLFVEGEWVYTSDSAILISSKNSEQESHSEYFYKIENLAELLTQKHPTVTSVSLIGSDQVKITLSDGSFIIKKEEYEGETLFVSITVTKDETVSNFDISGSEWQLDLWTK